MILIFHKGYFPLLQLFPLLISVILFQFLFFFIPLCHSLILISVLFFYFISDSSILESIINSCFPPIAAKFLSNLLLKHFTIIIIIINIITAWKKNVCDFMTAKWW